jgi:ribosomal protein S18 acetylase RimI-like enzyme
MNAAVPVIEQISAENLLAFKAVRLRALQDSPSAFGSTYARESQFPDAEWLKRAERWSGDTGVGYLAMELQIPCGIAGAFLDEHNPAQVHLISMWVAPTHRRTGLGRALVGAVQAWARMRGGHTLQLMVTSNNFAAIEFYKRIGFSMTGRTEPYPNDPALIEYEMSQSFV